MTVYRNRTLVGLMLGLLLSLFLTQGGVAFAQNDATPVTTTDPASLYPAVDMIKRVGPAVVTVINEQTASTGTSSSLQPVGSGTGFIIDNDGHIVTNWHVVDQGQKFQVILANGETRDATLIGSDQVSDLAVVQITGTLPGVVSFGDSSALLPGEPVIAIGSPLGSFTNTATEGIVSAVGRDFPRDASQGPQIYSNLIQHDAAINPGNSGGPLFNLQGEVVGVNTLGIPVDPSSNQPIQGLFFAIPSNTVQHITEQLISTGKVVYPYVGVSTQTVTPDIAVQAKLSVDQGELVGVVAPGGPAEAAGIQVGDVIVSIDGQTIDPQHSLVDLLFAHQPGDTVTLVIQRGADQKSIDVTLGERPLA